MASTHPHLWRDATRGYWHVDWFQGGRRRRLSLRTRDRAEAERKLDQFVAGLANPAPPKQVMLTDILAGYLRDRLPVVSSKLTLQNSCKQVEKVLGNLAPEHISQSTINGYAKTRASDGLLPGSIIRELVTLRAAMRWAVREKWILREAVFRMPVAQPQPRDRYLSRDEIQALLKASEDTPHLHLFLKLMLGTAARPGAILGLTWDRVDLDAGLINLGDSVGNKRKAVVPVNDMVRAALTEAWEVSTCRHVIAFRGRKVGSIKTAFRKAVARTKLTDVVPHTLRHTAATMMVMSGVPLVEVARMMGDSERIVERVYGKHSPSYLKRASSALNFA